MTTFKEFRQRDGDVNIEGYEVHAAKLDKLR